MAYSKNKLEVHSQIARLYERYRNHGFISFKNTPEIKGTQYLEPIISAIENQQVIRLYYLPFYEDKPYFNEVHPYLLKEHGFRWYLVGLNEFKGQVRTYALDRIRDLKEAEGIMYAPALFDANKYFKHSIGIIAPEGTPALIKMAVQKTQAQYLITQPWHDSQNIEEETEEEVIFSFRVHPTYEFKSLVLSLGKDGRIIEPKSLKEELRNELSQMLKKY
ncbi:MAG: WYL domain-containing protein [Bacteroidia bacterium]|nr:MAG: WYL domain-containing protein [Bacteroidia bacterium]